MGRQAFVTGATGFVGRHLVDELVRHGWTVRALVRAASDTRHLESVGVELYRGDLRDAASLAGAVEGADVVYHLAAVTAARSDDEYRDTNESGTVSLVDALLEPGADRRRLVYLSSYAACGPASDGRPRALDTPPAPLTAYGRTKLAGEQAVARATSGGHEIVVVRAPVVYGPGDRALLPYYRLVRWWLAPAPGGEDRKLHLVYAPDLAAALRRAADVPPGTYAVAEPAEHRWGDIVAAIAAGLERRPVRVPVPAPLVRAAATATEAAGRFAGRAVPFNREKAEEMLAPAWICNLAGSESLLPRSEATPLHEGIARTIRWYIRQGWL